MSGAPGTAAAARGAPSLSKDARRVWAGCPGLLCTDLLLNLSHMPPPVSCFPPAAAEKLAPAYGPGPWPQPSSCRYDAPKERPRRCRGVPSAAAAAGSPEGGAGGLTSGPPADMSSGLRLSAAADMTCSGAGVSLKLTAAQARLGPKEGEAGLARPGLASAPPPASSLPPPLSAVPHPSAVAFVSHQPADPS